MSALSPALACITASQVDELFMVMLGIGLGLAALVFVLVRAVIRLARPAQTIVRRRPATWTPPPEVWPAGEEPTR